MRLREIVKLWARVCFGKPSGAKFVGKDGLNAVTVVAPAGRQGPRHELRRQCRQLPNVSAGQRLQPGPGHDRRQGRPLPAPVAAEAPPGLLRAHRRGAARRHRRARGEGPHQRGAALQRDHRRAVSGHARGRQGLRRQLRRARQRPRLDHDLGRARGERGGQLLRLPHQLGSVHQRRHADLRRRVHPQRAYLPQGGVGVRGAGGPHVRQLPPPERRDLQGGRTGAGGGRGRAHRRVQRCRRRRARQG